MLRAPCGQSGGGRFTKMRMLFGEDSSREMKSALQGRRAPIGTYRPRRVARAAVAFIVAATAMATKPLVVMIVYFGELPVWLPLTLQSMFANSRVDFVVITDAAAPAILPPNVHFERISFGAMQLRLCLLYTSPSPRDRQKSRMPSSA